MVEGFVCGDELEIVGGVVDLSAGASVGTALLLVHSSFYESFFQFLCFVDVVLGRLPFLSEVAVCVYAFAIALLG